ncbi:hypothetical protein ACIQVC_29630 [Streptomyces sp. NPDC101112]|uniref:hypothetical protein n=1 Tax=Streptomyces sp. NPDC101112 TaxID=3366105 RepID=UPI0038189E12
MKKNGMTAGLPLVIGSVIAAGSIAQENYGGALFAVVACGAVSLVLRIRANPSRGR